MSTEALSAVFESAAINAQPIGSEYLAMENLRKGQVLNGFFVDYKEREILNEESGELVVKKAVSFLLIDEEAKTIKHYINAGVVLTEAFGRGGIRPYTAVRLQYDGAKSGQGGKRVALWTPSILPVNLIDHIDKLPPLIRSLLDRKQVEEAALPKQAPQVPQLASNEHAALTAG